MKQQVKLISAFSSTIALIIVIGAYNIYQDSQIEKISDTIRFELKPTLESLLEMRKSILLIHFYTEQSLDIINKKHDSNSLLGPDENLQHQLEEEFGNKISQIEKEVEHFRKAFLEYNELVETYLPYESDFQSKINDKFDELILFNSQIMQSGVTDESLKQSFSDFDKISIQLVLDLDEITEHELHEIEELEEIVEHTIQESSSVTIILFVTSVVLAIIISILSGNSLLKPIKALLRGSQEVSKGNFDYKIKSIGSDEHKILIESFNKMTKSLEEKIEVEKQLIIKNEEVKHQKIATIGELSSRIAHDIRNPLAVIKGALQLFENNENMSLQERERLDMIHDSVNRISYQVDSVLDFVRKKPIEKTHSTVFEIIDKAVDGIQIPKEIRIEKVGDEAIYCDFHAIEVVFVNLIMNAVQAINGEGRIKFSCSLDDDSLIIQIEDSGPGIADDHISKIFDPLFTTKQEGTGLGLASCKSIIKQHDGTITFSNNPSRFIIKLPKNPEV